MSPDLTNLQLISLGIAIAIAMTFTTVLILTLVYAEEIRRHLQRSQTPPRKEGPKNRLGKRTIPRALCRPPL